MSIMFLISFISSSYFIITLLGFIPNNIPFCFPNEENGMTFSFALYSSSILFGISSKSPPNIFSKLFPQYGNLSREYDWLSFIGTYAGTIVSSVLLIFITEKDRNENTAVLRTSQRPYLDISYMIINSKFFEEKKDNVTTFSHGKNSDITLEKDEYLTLCIKNNGAGVAIIDTNKTRVKLQYKIKCKIEETDFNLNFSINRLSIKSGEVIYIKFVKDELYKNKKLLNESKIISSTIFYKDLFNKNYYDQCELKKTLVVLHDNEEI